MKIDFLNDLTLGTAQKSGPMTVIPLLGEDITKDLATFSEIKFEKVETYGEMVFSNNSDKPFILPAGYAIMTKQLAQDHALVYSTILPGNKKTIIETACCIQQTQCGYIDGKGIKHFNFIPTEIRKGSVLNHTNGSLNFSRLWPLISSFQKKLVKDEMGNLILFFNKYMDKLLSYNAEFECVAGQRGAIILFNNEIVGIEIAPTQEYWKTIWNPLIRDSYGSTILRNALKDPTNGFLKNTNNIFSDCKTPEEMLKALDNTAFVDKINVLSKIEELSVKDMFNDFAVNMKKIDKYSIPGFTHLLAKSETSAIIDMHKQGNKIIYLSYLA